MTPPPRPVPTMAEIEVAVLARAEDREVAPEGTRVAVVEVRDRLAKLVRERLAQIEAGPRRDGRSWSTRARSSTPVLLAGPGVSSPTTTTCSRSIPAFATAIVEAVGDLLQADVGTLFGPRRVLAKPVDQPAFVAVDKRVVDGRAAEVNPRDDRPRCQQTCCRDSTLGVRSCSFDVLAWARGQTVEHPRPEPPSELRT